MTDAHGIARDQLRAFVERIERLEAEKQTISDDIRDVKAEAKAMGFSVKAINEIIKLRKKDEAERNEEELILDTYKAALGMIPAFERETGDVTIIDREDSDGNRIRVTVDPEIAAILNREPKQSQDTAPASQGEADAPSDERVRPTGSAAANVGGDHVTETPRSADIRPGLVSNPPAHHPLRPNCKNPGSQCAGYGSKLCHACAVAAKELETA